jgi:N-formylglutamate amidohydrolase
MHAIDTLNHQINMNHSGFKAHYGLEPIILNFPHSGRTYPENHLKFINHSKKSLRVFEDPYLDIILPDIERYHTSYLINECARVFIDVNRALQENPHKPMLNGEAMGLIPTAFPCGNPLYSQRLHQYEIDKRIHHYYNPYHTQLELLMCHTQKKFPKILLIDCHSMPSHGDKSDPDAFKARPDIIIGDNFGTSASHDIVAVIEQGFIEMGLSVFRNFPYAGGHIINHYSSLKKNIHAVQIEINRRLYVTDKTFKLTHNAKNITEQFHTVLQKLKPLLIA